MEKFEIVGVVEPDEEDCGAALIAEIIADGDETFFVRLQSYDENVWEDDYEGETHAFMNKIRGKRVRITVEVIED